MLDKNFSPVRQSAFASILRRAAAALAPQGLDA